MKNFRKKDDLFICEECNKLFTTLRGLSTHIQMKHSNKLYYDKWLKDEGDDECKICKKPTKFVNMSVGYKNGCSREHIVKWNHDKIQDAIYKKYGVKSILSLKEYKERGMIKKFGVNNPFKSPEIKEKIRNTNLKKYGVDNPAKSSEIKEKIRKSFIRNLGVEYPTKSNKIKEKIKNTYKTKYNVEHPLQYESFFKKQQKNSYFSKTYKITSVNYRGSYELDFLEKYYDKFLDIRNPAGIKYELHGKKRIYFPDFYIPSLNLIVECKNSYLMKKDKEQIDAKEKATIANGFKYIIIVDKDYIVFENLYLNL